jgi:hypothetical protein
MIRKILMTIVMVALLAGVVQSADNYYNGTVTVDNSYEKVTIKWVSSVFGADSIANLHSPPIYIGDINLVDGWITGVTVDKDDTEDVDVFLHVGDKVDWTTITSGLVQLTGSTAQQDTIGITNGVNDLAYHANGWIVIEADGLAGNDTETYVTITLTLPKPTGAYFNNQPIQMGSFQRTPVSGDTNP